MTHAHNTSMGGSDGAFDTTHWSAIVQASAHDPARRQQAIEHLLERYWRPVYVYLRRRGHTNDAAKDLTQGFFQQVVLGRDLAGRADPAKGRFRTLLLTALDRYVTDVHRAHTAQKRMPAAGLVRLDAVGPDAVPEPSDPLTPEEAFAYEWARSLLDQVLIRLEADCRQDNMATHWEMFAAKVLRPIMEGAATPSLETLCVEHGIAHAKRGANMIVTVKRRFRAVMRRLVALGVGSEAEVDDEIADLMRILSEGSAAS